MKIKGSIHQVYIAITNILHQTSELKYLKLTLTELKEETDSKTITVGVFNTPTFSHE